MYKVGKFSGTFLKIVVVENKQNNNFQEIRLLLQ